MTTSSTHRHIQGGNAEFIAGCVLSGFSLSPSIRITNKLSMRAHANTILISWRPSSDFGSSVMKADLESVAGSLKFYYRVDINNTLHSSVRGRLPTSHIAGFYLPEHALAALKHLSGNAELDAHLMYTVYFTTPKELSDAVMVNVEDTNCMLQVAEASAVWGKPREDMVTLRLSGKNQDEVVDMKRILEAKLSGRIATTGLDGDAARYEIWHDFFATASGAGWLQDLARENGVIIISDKFQQRLRVHDPEQDDARMGLVEHTLAEKAIIQSTLEETTTIQLTLKDFQELLTSDKVARAQVKLGESKVSLDVLKKALVLHCTQQTAWLVISELNLPLPHHTCPLCDDATNDVKLSNCGHYACKECFDLQLQVASSDLSNDHFPLVCWHDDCKQPIAIADLHKHATGTMIDALLKASLNYYIRSSPAIYRNCRAPDCKAVYRRGGSHGIFTCRTCLTQTCTLCHAEPHVGWTCAQYESRVLKNELNEQLLDEYKAAAGTKECLKCATLIEKVDGCNYVECNGCHGHICWVCLKVFSEVEVVYQHMNDAHGGNGLVEGSDDEISESGSDDWEDENDFADLI